MTGELRTIIRIFSLILPVCLRVAIGARPFSWGRVFFSHIEKRPLIKQYPSASITYRSAPLPGRVHGCRLIRRRPPHTHSDAEQLAPAGGARRQVRHAPGLGPIPFPLPRYPSQTQEECRSWRGGRRRTAGRLAGIRKSIQECERGGGV